MTITYITKHLNTQKKCVKFIEEKRWNGIPTCPYCKSKKSSPKALRHTCLDCNRSFSVKVGTAMQNSNLPLQKWLMAISLMMSAKKGISSLQLSRDLTVNKNTAWLLQMKIRAAMREGELEYFQRENRKVKITLTGKFGAFQRRKKANGEHVSGIDRSYWGHLKRALIGQYHRIEECYLFRYVDEISFKYSRKNQPDFGCSELIQRVLRI